MEINFPSILYKISMGSLFSMGAFLKGAFSKGANLKGAFLKGANLKGAFLQHNRETCIHQKRQLLGFRDDICIATCCRLAIYLTFLPKSYYNKKNPMCLCWLTGSSPKMPRSVPAKQHKTRELRTCIYTSIIRDKQVLKMLLTYFFKLHGC